MRRPATTLLVPLIGWLLVFPCMNPAFGQLSDSTEGLDVIVLVDVSESMYAGRDARNNPLLGEGSDPERLRWDTVKLIIDLLSEKDRIAIIPFNNSAPATHGGKPIPADFAMRLHDLQNEGTREILKSRIRDATVLHGPVSIPTAGETPIELEADGTSIINALDVAWKMIGKDYMSRNQGGGLKNPYFVLLLTDGKEDYGSQDTPDPQSLDKLFRERANLYKVANDRYRKAYERDFVVLYAVGLGNEVEPRLRDFATHTRGKYLPAQDNKELINTFRGLIWQLKKQWIWKATPASLRRGDSQTFSIESLAGVIDLGVLCYQEEERERVGRFRTTFPPYPAPSRQLSPTAPGIKEAHRTVTLKDRQRGRLLLHDVGHSYFYYDISRRSDVREFINKGDGLSFDMKFDSVRHPTYVYFVQRSYVDFDLRLGDSSFYRHQPIPLKVVMQQSPKYDADLFEVEVHLAHRNRPTQKVPFQLAEETDVYGRRFFHDAYDKLAASLVDPEGGKEPNHFDSYTIEVLIRGKKNAKNTSLSRFERQMRSRPVTIFHTVPLTHRPEVIALDRFASRKDIQLQTIVDFIGTIPISVNLNAPTIKDIQGAFDPSYLSLTVDGRPIESAGTASLTNGKSVIRLALRTDKLTDEEFSGTGSIVVTAQNPQQNTLRLPVVDHEELRQLPPSDRRRFAYEIPFRISTKKSIISILPSQIRLRTGSAVSADSETVTVRPVRVASQNATEGTIQVELRARAPAGEATADAGRFKADELWIQPEGPPFSADRRVQKLPIDGRETRIQVHFQPNPLAANDAIGVHEYELVASGRGYDEAMGRVELTIDPPRLEIRSRPATRIASHPGGTVESHAHVGLRWLPGGKWTFSVQPDSRLEFRAHALFGDTTSSPFVAPFRYAPKPLELTAPSAAAPETNEQDVTFQVSLPLDARPGYYQSRANFISDGKIYGEFVFDLEVNVLFLEFPVHSPATLARFGNADRLAPQRVTDGGISLTQFYRLETTRTLAVKNFLDRPMSTRNLQVTVGDGDGSSGGKFLRNVDSQLLPAPQPKIRLNPRDPKALLVDLPMEQVRNADPTTPYSVDLTFRYRDPVRDIGAVTTQLHVRFVNSQELIESKPAP